MRVYLPATFGMLAGLNETGTLTARSGSPVTSLLEW